MCPKTGFVHRPVDRVAPRLPVPDQTTVLVSELNLQMLYCDCKLDVSRFATAFVIITYGTAAW